MQSSPAHPKDSGTDVLSIVAKSYVKMTSRAPWTTNPHLVIFECVGAIREEKVFWLKELGPHVQITFLNSCSYLSRVK